MEKATHDEPGLLEGLLEDGRPAIHLTAVALLLFGVSILTEIVGMRSARRPA